MPRHYTEAHNGEGPIVERQLGELSAEAVVASMSGNACLKLGKEILVDVCLNAFLEELQV